MEKIDIEKLGKVEVVEYSGEKGFHGFYDKKAILTLAEKINEIVDWCNNLDSYLKHK